MTFSEDVTGVDTTDFTLSSDSTGGSSSAQFTQTRSPAIAITAANTITDTITVTGSGTVTSVSVAIDVSHTYIGDLKIDLIAPDGTTKILHNRSGGSADDIDQTYTPDFAGVSIAGTWTLQINDNYATADDGTLNSWTLTINPDSSSSSSSGTSNPVTSISGSGDTYQVTVSATQDGTYNLDLISSGHDIEDESNNPLTDVTPTTGTDETYTVNTVPADTTAPTLSSIERYNPATENTDSQTLIYEVTFSEDVTGVDTTDFTLSSDSTGGSSSAQFTQTRSPAIAITAANTITDTITVTGSGTVTSVSVAIDVSHTYIGDLKIDLIAPDGTTKILHNRSGGSADDIDQTYTPDFAGVSIAGTWTLQINDNYATADDGTLNSWTLTINPGSSSSDTSTPVTSISGSGDTYQVTVLATQDGTYNLDLISSGHGIEDESNNPLTDVTPTTGTDETYTVNTVPADTTAPTLSSIEWFSPVTENTNSQTLIYEVTFSEDVTGVDTTDFTLSSDSTGGSSSAQFTQTRSPAIAITAANTITDTITVTGSGTVTSVSVAIDVSHTYIGDLKIDLIAPDGTTKILHNRSGGSADDIDQTYTPDFAGVSIAGTWTLQINDNYATADDGTLNSWTLTINPGSSSSDTSTPVTSISGSGDTYQVTVLATQDGTYNLDLISSGHGIEDESNNPLTDVTPTTGTDETYTVNTVPDDTTAPTLSSIERYNPATENTDSQTLTYKVTFSEDVTGVDTTDFAMSSDSPTDGYSQTFMYTSTPSLDIVPHDTDKTDTITVSASGTVSDVSVVVDITHTWRGDLLVQLVSPDNQIVTLHNRVGGSVDDITETYTLEYDDDISINGDWQLRMNDNYYLDSGILNSWTLTLGDGTTTINPISSVTGSGSQYYVTIMAITSGVYNLDIAQDTDIVNSANIPLTSLVPANQDHSYNVTITVDNVKPVITLTDSTVDTTLGTPYVDAGATCIDNTDGDISQSHIQVDNPVNTDIAGTYTITFTCDDSAGNPAVPVTRTVNVIDIPPTVTSITRSNPADASTNDHTLEFAVLFSEAVTGVSTDDFELSPDSPAYNATQPFTYTSTPSLDIVPHDTDKTDTITVSASGTVSDVSVVVDITHTWRGDLLVQLVSPDNQIVTLHNRVGGSADDITETYTLEYGDDVSINGDWQLRMNDNYYLDSGVLNSWTLTLGDGASSGPITSVTGSGSQYLVTVSAPDAGTYNLDVSSDNNIVDSASNPLSGLVSTTGDDQSYTVTATTP